MAWVQESWRADQLSYTQLQIQGFEWAHPNIYPNYKLLEYMKGLVQQIQSCRIFVTQGNNKDIQEESP